MRNITSKQLADEFGIAYPVAAGIMKMLVQSGQARPTARVFHKSGKGKPTTVYLVANQVKFNIPKIKPAPKYKAVGMKLVQTTNVRSKYEPKYKKAV
jgi:predicted transcriptional regulator